MEKRTDDTPEANERNLAGAPDRGAPRVGDADATQRAQDSRRVVREDEQLATRDVLTRDAALAAPAPASLTGGSAPVGTRLEAGQVVSEKYEVIRLLGQGGMGTVWLVRHRELDVERALKMIVSGISTGTDARARLKREARVMAKFTHPHAVTVHDARMTDEAAFIEMEFVRGQCISAVLEPGEPMPLDWTARILTQLCDVLEAAHEMGIVHRDLKPTNLMLLDGRPAGQEFLKVLDFGIAKLLGVGEDSDDLHTRTGMFVGTAPYASPDQLAKGTVDGRSDLYSVGVLLYEFLTGYRPFTGPTTIYDHLHKPPPAFAAKNAKVQVPAEVERVVMRCLAKNPDERPQTARELCDEFLAAIGQLPAGPTQPDRLARTPLAQPFGPPTEKDTYETVELPETEAIEGKRKRHARVTRTQKLIGIVTAVLVLAGGSWAIFGLPRNRGTTWPSSQTRDPSTSSQESKASLASTVPEQPATPRFPPAGYRAEGDKAIDSWPAVLRDRRGGHFHFIKGGQFQMGAPDSAKDVSDDERPAHMVEVSPFYLQEKEVTFGELEAFFDNQQIPREERPSHYRKARDELSKLGTEVGGIDADRYPAVGVPWVIAEKYARWAGGRLPTEAEWEYAASSGGTRRPYVMKSAEEPKRGVSANISTIGDRQLMTSPGGEFADDKTEQGVFDLTGNVREWCRDVWGEYPKKGELLRNPVPLGPPGTAPDDSNQDRAIRGGSYKSDLERARTSFRSDRKPGYDDEDDLGFRIVIEAPPDLRPK